MYIIRLIVCIAVVFSELYMFDPWRVHFYYSSHDMNMIMLLYLAMAIISGVIGAVLAPMIIHKILSRTRVRNALNIGIVTFVILMVMAILCGPYRVIDIFKNRILGCFFMEWEFAKFIVQIAFPFSIFAAGLEFIFGKKYAVPTKPHFQKDGKFLNL